MDLEPQRAFHVLSIPLPSTLNLLREDDFFVASTET
jgi:hypothetical protein